MGFEVKLDRRTPWVLSITQEPGQLKYHVDRRTGEDDSWRAVSREDLEHCRDLAARLLSDRRLAGESIDSLRAAISGRLIPAGLRQELCGEGCVEAGLVIRDDTEWRIPWHILFPHGSMRLDERMYLPEPSRHKPSALFLLDPCSDLLYSMGRTPTQCGCEATCKPT